MRPSLLPSLTSSFSGFAFVCGTLLACSSGSGSPPVSADNPTGTACLADLEKRCKGTLAACWADRTCSEFTTSCMNTSYVTGAWECMSAAQGTAETDVFDCMQSSAPCQVQHLEVPALDAGNDGSRSDASDACVSPGLASDNAAGDACIADLESRCKAAFDACSADCACAEFTSQCMDTSFFVGPYECMSAAQGPLETQIFDCMEPSTVCQNARPPRDAGAGD